MLPALRKLSRKRPSLAVVLSISALVFAMSGLAVAAGGGPSGTIRACYRTHGGALRVATKCSTNEKPLVWNQSSRGGTGAGFSASRTTFHFAVNAHPQTLLQLKLPAGSFVVFAKLNGVDLNTASTTAFNCFLRAGNNVDETDGALETYSGANAYDQSLTNTLAHTFSAPGTVRLRCETSGIAAVRADYIRITAIQVQRLH